MLKAIEIYQIIQSNEGLGYFTKTTGIFYYSHVQIWNYALFFSLLILFISVCFLFKCLLHQYICFLVLGEKGLSRETEFNQKYEFICVPLTINKSHFYN